MSHNTTKFKAPALPNAPVQYSAQSYDSLNKILRIYFNQIDATNVELIDAVSALEQAVVFNQRYTLVMT